MKCPVCSIDMIVVEYEKIELDHCVRCGGVWFDATELELLLATMSIERPPDGILSRPETPPMEKRRKCPICRRRMDKATIGNEPAVLIDACPRGDGLWFDSGEIQQVAQHMAGRMPEEVDAGAVNAFLSHAFEAKARAPGGHEP